MILLVNLREDIKYQQNNFKFHEQKTQTKTKNTMSENKANLVFIGMFNFLGLKVTSMQALLHFCQPRY
jgi:fucose permease